MGSAITVDTTPGITSHSKNEEFALCDALTAKLKGSWLWWNDLSFTLNAPVGHLPRGGAFMGWGLGDFWTGCKMLSSLTLKLAN